MRSGRLAPRVESLIAKKLSGPSGTHTAPAAVERLIAKRHSGPSGTHTAPAAVEGLIAKRLSGPSGAHTAPATVALNSLMKEHVSVRCSGKLESLLRRELVSLKIMNEDDTYTTRPGFLDITAKPNTYQSICLMRFA